MRILAEKYGRLHVNVFHNRVQFFMRDGRKVFSIFYHLNLHVGDKKTDLEMEIPIQTVRSLFRKAFSSKRWKKDKSRWIPDDVLVWLKTEWGVEP